MALAEFNKYEDPEVRAWAMIWKVAPQMERVRPLTEGDQETIDEISKLRTEGKLTDAQKKVLDTIGMNVSIDYDGF